VLTLLCSEARYLPRLLAALPAEDSVTHAESWDEVHRHARPQGCSVIVAEWLPNTHAHERLTQFRNDFPSHPLVVVTHEDAENARSLAELRVSEVLWIREIEERLGPAVSRARAVTALAALTAAFESAHRLPPRLRSALRDACTSSRPPRSLSRLAANAGCHRSTLWVEWRQAVGDRNACPDLRLEDLLDWLILISAVHRKAPGVKWTAVAHDMGVHEHTLARQARRLTGLTLREVERVGTLPLLARFSELVRPLLD
jgi:AraC-like DNA-binding protein